MKKFLIAGSSLAAVAAAGSAGAVDVTLGGSIDMGVEFGVGKNKGSLGIGEAYNTISLSLAAAGTTDAGMRYGGSFTLATADEIELSAYEGKNLLKMTVSGATDIEAAAYNVSGGQMINAAEIVGVKINSQWQSVGDTQTGFGLQQQLTGAENICKLAGIGTVTATATANYTRMAANGDAGGLVAIAAGTDYLPAGKLTAAAAVTVTGGVAVSMPLGFDADGVVITANRVTPIGAGEVSNTGSGAVNAVHAFVAADPAPTNFNATVLDADVFIGPFMEVKLQSSSTKMVVGAVCVEGIDASATNYFLNNASKVVTASDASIFIEGGFGKVTLQTGDYAGGVSAIGDAGSEADLDVEGLAVIVEGVGLLGANPYLAVDLAPTTATEASNLSNLEILTGGTIDMGGLSVAVDVALKSTDVVDIVGWDLGMDYAMGDMALAFAYDSANNWGMSASMGVAGFAVDATIYNANASDHEKSGLFYSVGASTSLNGFGLSLGVDQDMQPTVGLSKSMGGLSIYAGYDAADEGGKVGATLSF